MDKVLQLETDNTGIISFIRHGVTVTVTVEVDEDGDRTVNVETKAADKLGGATWAYRDEEYLFGPYDNEPETEDEGGEE